MLGSPLITTSQSFLFSSLRHMMMMYLSPLLQVQPTLSAHTHSAQVHDPRFGQLTGAVSHAPFLVKVSRVSRHLNCCFFCSFVFLCMGASLYFRTRTCPYWLSCQRLLLHQHTFTVVPTVSDVRVKGCSPAPPSSILVIILSSVGDTRCHSTHTRHARHD